MEGGKRSRMDGEHLEEGKDWKGVWNKCRESGREGIKGGRLFVLENTVPRKL